MSDEQHAQVTSLHDGSQKTPTPYSLPEANSPRAISSRGAQLGQRIGLGIGVVVLAIASGIGGSYALLSSGLVKLDATQTITQNRDKIVLQQGEIVADVATKVSPSVVSITTQGVTQGRSSLFGGTGAVIQGAGSGIVV